ncbi:MAG: helix-turn-helix transcriptional regulator [Planctomycetes bacterium]|nr:helix-turn-helix transcriptional regulator [Planctomycetota bacterium]
MDKTIHTRENRVIVALLKEAREAANLTQIELAKLLKQSQSFVSKMEAGERRLDLVQLRTVCSALGITLPEFVERFEKRRTNENHSPAGQTSETRPTNPIPRSPLGRKSTGSVPSYRRNPRQK